MALLEIGDRVHFGSSAEQGVDQAPTHRNHHGPIIVQTSPRSESHDHVEPSEHVGRDRFLRLTMPVDEPDRTDRVIVLIEPESANAVAGRDEWLPGFIESTVRARQGDFPNVADLGYEQRLQLLVEQLWFAG